WEATKLSISLGGQHLGRGQAADLAQRHERGEERDERAAGGGDGGRGGERADRHRQVRRPEGEAEQCAGEAAEQAERERLAGDDPPEVALRPAEAAKGD